MTKLCLNLSCTDSYLELSLPIISLEVVLDWDYNSYLELSLSIISLEVVLDWDYNSYLELPLPIIFPGSSFGLGL